MVVIPRVHFKWPSLRNYRDHIDFHQPLGLPQSSNYNPGRDWKHALKPFSYDLIYRISESWIGNINRGLDDMA